MLIRLIQASCAAVSFSIAAAVVAGEEVGEDPVPTPTIYIGFEDTANELGERSASRTLISGLEREALRIEPGQVPVRPTVDSSVFTPDSDFALQCWVRTTVDSSARFVVLSQKDMPDMGLASQKRAGWMLGVSDGTWMWNIGSGNRRLTYFRDNGEFMPINDGRWHQFVMSHNSSTGLMRLFYDGRNVATYNLRDTNGFDFTSGAELTIGWQDAAEAPRPDVLPAITDGADQLQALVDAFNALGLPAVDPDELIELVVGSERLFARKRDALDPAQDADLLQALDDTDFTAIEGLTHRLMRNPYTVHQVMDYMKVAPMRHLYELVDGEVVIQHEAALRYTARERLDPPAFDIDELSVWDRALTAQDVRDLYANYALPTEPPLDEELAALTACAWNIHHGGIHETVDEDGWDSRRVIVDLIQREEIDIVMMQESYSNVDYIAAELGYYFATTVDWDYLNQGANISVLSRYPIEEVFVPVGSSFMNVAAKIRLSETQHIYAMSNWYGMDNFPEVFAFHESRFEDADRIPILFAGDFNAVPHTDGGNSPASRRLLDAGFTDAFRQQFPDAAAHPGPTHTSGRRIDQLYYRGAGLTHTSTSVISTWPSVFPSDHFVIKTIFDCGDESLEESP